MSPPHLKPISSNALGVLGDAFYDAVVPARFPSVQLRHDDVRWRGHIGLGGLGEDAVRSHFTRFEPFQGSLTEPLAMRYHGHQFRSYNPHLGDGRGFTFAQFVQLGGPEAGRLLDLGTKGSGTTPHSQRGDGRLTLQGGVREVLASAMLEALGVNTSKALALHETGESLHRDDEPSPTRSAVLVRLSHGHIRIGTFQKHAFDEATERVEALLHYCAEHYYPALPRDDTMVLALDFVYAVTRRLARLAASWTVAGFAHGVLNTDNINITGESFDYGPYRFVPACDPGFVAAHFDETGLYAFGRQPQTLLWNIARLCDALRSIAPRGVLEEATAHYENEFRRGLADRFTRRLGLEPADPDTDDGLAMKTISWLVDSQVGYDQFFFDWFGGGAVATRERIRHSPQAEAYRAPGFAEIAALLKTYEPARAEVLDDPYFAKLAPCGLLDDDLRTIWAAIDDRDDWGPFHAKLAAIDGLRVLNERVPAV
ncbi:MAG: hypothetical protein ACI9MR_005231 [Myxococcota bacterium]|jgi:uncharacterized protein YdiU (UPF0061 family)